MRAKVLAPPRTAPLRGTAVAAEGIAMSSSNWCCASDGGNREGNREGLAGGLEHDWILTFQKQLGMENHPN
jgi:hypothetical protein